MAVPDGASICQGCYKLPHILYSSSSPERTPTTPTPSPSPPPHVHKGYIIQLKCVQAVIWTTEVWTMSCLLHRGSVQYCLVWQQSRLSAGYGGCTPPAAPMTFAGPWTYTVPEYRLPGSTR
ncbi:hypothetical protein ACOMHN_003278 [Nucella lapillus]